MPETTARSAMRASAALATLLCLVALLALTAPRAAASPADKAILVLGENNQVLASFDKVKCRVSKKGGGGKFKATGSDGGWKLDVRINDFAGYHDYGIEYGIRRTNFSVIPPGTKSYYSSFFFPGDQAPPFGGALTFPGGKGTMGLGFIAAYFSHGDDAVALGGKAKCSYPKKGK